MVRTPARLLLCGDAGPSRCVVAEAHEGGSQKGDDCEDDGD